MKILFMVLALLPFAVAFLMMLSYGPVNALSKMRGTQEELSSYNRISNVALGVSEAGRSALKDLIYLKKHATDLNCLMLAKAAANEVTDEDKAMIEVVSRGTYTDLGKKLETTGLKVSQIADLKNFKATVAKYGDMSDNDIVEDLTGEGTLEACKDLYEIVAYCKRNIHNG